RKRPKGAKADRIMPVRGKAMPTNRPAQARSLRSSGSCGRPAARIAGRLSRSAVRPEPIRATAAPARLVDHHDAALKRQHGGAMDGRHYALGLQHHRGVDLDRHRLQLDRHGRDLDGAAADLDLVALHRLDIALAGTHLRRLVAELQRRLLVARVDGRDVVASLDGARVGLLDGRRALALLYAQGLVAYVERRRAVAALRDAGPVLVLGARCALERDRLVAARQLEGAAAADRDGLVVADGDVVVVLDLHQ